MIHPIDLLYFEDCPFWKTALEMLRQVIEAQCLPCEVRLLEIQTESQAQAERFLGSPSFHLDGVDLWPETRARYTLCCRLYPASDGLRGTPTAELLAERIQALLQKPAA